MRILRGEPRNGPVNIQRTIPIRLPLGSRTDPGSVEDAAGRLAVEARGNLLPGVAL